ncbi:facilitated trehalose transporter Tret1-like [Epargyreus clarus]|uniref:facilitated trehalose transporter Tret1-like n=1 Tax=Epargyreus clarus TaxID=520877 RepID=UPI003C2D0309
MKVPEIFTSNILREYAIVFIVNLSVVTTGMSLGWPSPMLVKLNDPSQTHLGRPVTTEEGSWIVSIGFLICIFTNIPLGYLIHTIGRKYTLILAMVPKLCACCLFLFGREIWMIIMGRALFMVGDSAVLVAVPVYASEIASKERRGALGTFLQIFCSTGIVIALSVGPFVSFYTYNTVLASAIAVTGLPLLILPESPSYQHCKGKIAEATKTLIFLRGSEAAAKTELQEYSSSKNETKVELLALLQNRLFLKSLGIAFLLSGGAQFVGFNAVSYYMQTILESTHTNVRSEIGSVIIGVIQLFASLCTAPITDRFGRRPILIWSTAGILVGLIGLGSFFQVSQTPGYIIQGFMNYLPTASLIIIVYCFSVGVGSLCWLLSAELFEGPARGHGVSAVMSLAMLMIFLLVKYFAAVTLALGAAATYWIFCVNCTIILTLIFLFVPETKKKSFEEIQRALMERSFYFGRE